MSKRNVLYKWAQPDEYVQMNPFIDNGTIQPNMKTPALLLFETRCGQDEYIIDIIHLITNQVNVLSYSWKVRYLI